MDEYTVADKKSWRRATWLIGCDVRWGVVEFRAAAESQMWRGGFSPGQRSVHMSASNGCSRGKLKLQVVLVQYLRLWIGEFVGEFSVLWRWKLFPWWCLMDGSSKVGKELEWEREYLITWFRWYANCVVINVKWVCSPNLQRVEGGGQKQSLSGYLLPSVHLTVAGWWLWGWVEGDRSQLMLVSRLIIVVSLIPQNGWCCS